MELQQLGPVGGGLGLADGSAGLVIGGSYDVPMMRLTFSFRFGQMDMSLFKRKNMKGESEGTQGAMQGMQQ